jgi:hypothetical protein
MATELTNAERETHLNMTADNRDEWIVTSDDPIMCRRFEAIGATFVRAIGQLREYTIPANQISLRNPPKPMSEERRAELAMQLRAARENAVITGAENRSVAIGELMEVAE